MKKYGFYSHTEAKCSSTKTDQQELRKLHFAQEAKEGREARHWNTCKEDRKNSTLTASTYS